MKKFIILLVLIALLMAVVGCGGYEMTDGELGWSIVQSPITGRYYEIATRYDGYQGYMGMYEVTRADYEKYLLEKKAGD